MLSFMAPQYGRILQAHLRNDTKKLIVSYSKMYSFETNDVAPLELFYRWLLGDPVGMAPSMMQPLVEHAREEG